MRVVDAAHPEYEEARTGWNDCHQSRPLQVRFCHDADEVTAALAGVQERGLPFRVRSGGHSLEGFSALDDGVVIDLSEMDDIALSDDAATVTVGPGATLGRVYAALAERGRTIPGGLAPHVGVAGLTLGGGWGLLSRTHSVLAHALAALELVGADGRRLLVDAEHEPDLFWACRGGGGGSLGIVTQLTLRTIPHPDVVVLRLAWPAAAFDEVYDAYQRWLPDTDPRWNPLLVLPGGGGPIVLTGLFAGPQEAMTGELGALRHGLPPVAEERYATMPFRAALDAANALVDPAVFTRIRFTALEPFYETPLDAGGIALLRDWHARALPHTMTFVGGSRSSAVARRAAEDPIAYPHLDAGVTLNIRADWTDPARDAEYFDWMRGLGQDLAPYTTSTYLNWTDFHLDPRVEPRYGASLERLVEVKRRYDPENLFDQPAGIPTRGAA